MSGAAVATFMPSSGGAAPPDAAAMPRSAMADMAKGYQVARLFGGGAGSGRCLVRGRPVPPAAVDAWARGGLLFCNGAGRTAEGERCVWWHPTRAGYAKCREAGGRD